MIAALASIDWAEWANLGLRWLHLTTGIAWIGSSFYFVWLDNHLTAPAQGSASGELWSVHGGGFYHNQKYQVAPPSLPNDLHWFKWEAYWTWISGFSLLVLVYYLGANSYLIDPAKAALSQPAAIGIGLAALTGGWLVYDALCRSPLGASPRWFGVVWYALLVATAFALSQVFTARGTYLHIGAMIGTVMVGNVFFVIIPNQRKVVEALRQGREPDPALGKAGKARSVHNNYMTLPVLFIMISHHYPMTYGAAHPWLVLALIGAAGVSIRHVFNLRHKHRPGGAFIALAASLIALCIATIAMEKQSGAAVGPKPTTYADVQPLFAKHCSGCHAVHPTNPAFSEPPLGVLLDSYAHAKAVAPRIQKVAVEAEIMPLGNTTGMTRAERDMLGRWIAQGTPP